MTPTSLKRLISRSVKKQINEAVKAAGKAPKSFDSFRRMFTNALAAAKAPADLVAEVGDLGYEGGGPFGVLWEAWTNIEVELQHIKDPKELEDTWHELIEYYVHDAVTDMLPEYNNPMNYEPGHKAQKIDARKLAADVVEAMKSGAKPKKPAAKKNKYPIDVGDIVDAIEAEIILDGLKVDVGDVDEYNDVVMTVTGQERPESTCLRSVERILTNNGVKGRHFKQLGVGTVFKYSGKGDHSFEVRVVYESKKPTVVKIYIETF